jgi:hypothetical protein
MLCQTQYVSKVSFTHVRKVWPVPSFTKLPKKLNSIVWKSLIPRVHQFSKNEGAALKFKMPEW